jgi:multidrug resistance efflux pump
MSSPVSLKVQSSSAQATTPQAAEPAHAPHRRRHWAAWGAVVVLVVLAVVAFLAYRREQRSASAAATAQVTFAQATRGPLIRSIRVGGTVAAVHFAGITAPQLRGEGAMGGRGGGGGDRGGGGGSSVSVSTGGQGGAGMTIVKIVEAGKWVKKGDVLCEFDRTVQQNLWDSSVDEFASYDERIASQQAGMQINREDRITRLQQAERAVESAALDVKRSPVVSDIDAAKFQMTLTQAEENLRMYQETEKLRVASDEAQLKLLELQRERRRVLQDYLRANLDKMTVTAPIDGMVVLPPINRGGTSQGSAQEGDSVGGGAPFIQIIDSSEIVVRARVNQLDASLLQPGGAVVVHVDAFSDIALPGKVLSIAALAQNTGVAGKVKAFSVVFSVDGSDPRLFPDTSANVDVLVEQVPDAVLVPRGAVVVQADSRDKGFVWVKAGDRIQARAVTLGANNDTHWAILSGVKEGELVAAMPPPGALSALGRQAAPAKPAASQNPPKGEKKGPAAKAGAPPRQQSKVQDPTPMAVGAELRSLKAVAGSHERFHA